MGDGVHRGARGTESEQEGHNRSMEGAARRDAGERKRGVVCVGGGGLFGMGPPRARAFVKVYGVTSSPE
eukprot:1349745-Pleurochrysis_carterae.AAC.1